MSTSTSPPDAAGARLPTLHAGGFSASIEAFAWEPDPDSETDRMRLWFVSLLGSQEAVKALWARLVQGESATLSPAPPAAARFCALTPDGHRRWRFHTARLRAVTGVHGVLVPDAALYTTERSDFLLLARGRHELARHHFRFLNRRVDVPLHPAWTGWLWERAIRTGEAAALEGLGLHAYRCVPDTPALATDLGAAIRRGELPVANTLLPVPTTLRARAAEPQPMARLESTARAGYWPTPPRIAHAIARHLAPAEDRRKHVVRLLDPCAGTGEAAAIVARALGAEGFGVELNAERAAAARERLDRVLATSAFSVRLANGAFSCLFLNPPYAQDDEQRRLEHAFLTGMTRALRPGGVLVFVVPQPRLAGSARYLAAHYGAFRAHRFPDPEHGAFRQMVLLATRKARPGPDAGAQAQLEAWSGAALAPLPDEPEEPPLRVPAVPAGEVLFASLFFDPGEAATEARRRGVWAQPQLTEQLWPPDETPARPLTPLRRGHLALLMAAGFLDNVLLEQGGQRVLVKGRTRKELVRVEGGDAHTVVEREVLRTSLAVLDLHSGALEAIEHGGTVVEPVTRPATGGPA